LKAVTILYLRPVSSTTFKLKVIVTVYSHINNYAETDMIVFIPNSLATIIKLLKDNYAQSANMMPNLQRKQNFRMKPVHSVLMRPH